MSNEQILDSMPTADLVRALLKREYVMDMVVKSDNIRVIMLPNEVTHNE